MIPFKKMDNSYCLIRLILNRYIALYFFRKQNRNCHYPICFTAYHVDALSKLMSIHISLENLSIQHCLYLGKELYKAELCLKFNQEYIQD